MINLLKLLLVLMFFTAIHSPCFANDVSIISPQNGDAVGTRVVVEGKSSISDNSHVWVLVHVKLLQGQWWPQSKPVVDHEGNWQALVYLGGAQDVGMDFEIAVATFQDEQEGKIIKYHDIGNKTGQWLPIAFPKTTSKIDMVTVKKTQNQ